MNYIACHEFLFEFVVDKAFCVFSSRDFHVHSYQFCHEVSVFISSSDFLETSVNHVGGDNSAISICDFIGFPVHVCTNIDQVSSLCDLHRYNISAATANRDIDIEGPSVDKDGEMQTTHLADFLFCAGYHSSRDIFHRDFVFSSNCADSSVSGDFISDAFTDACSSTLVPFHSDPNYFVFLHKEVAAIST